MFNPVVYLINMVSRLYGVIFAATALAVTAVNASAADDWKFHSFDDGYVYTKSATDLDGKWKEEFGVGAPFLTGGAWLVKWNAAYVHEFPKAFNVGPSWTTGATAVYELAQGKVIPGIYTKIKNNLDGVWQQETGFTALSTVGHVGLGLTTGYVFAYPYKSSAGPMWQSALTIQFMFK